MTIWPTKPLPKELSIELLTTVYKRENIKESYDTLRSLCRELVVHGVKIPDQLVTDLKEGQGTHSAYENYYDNYDDYDPLDPNSIFELLLKYSLGGKVVCSKPAPDTVPICGYCRSAASMYLPKNLLRACMKKDIYTFLSFLYPSTGLYMNIFGGEFRISNKKLLRFIVEEGIQINPIEVLLAITNAWRIEAENAHIVDLFSEDIELTPRMTQKLKDLHKKYIGCKGDRMYRDRDRR